MECCLKCDPGCSVNKKLLPIKFHLFLYASGIATVLPFCPILAKSLGITATEVGIIYTIVPFITVFVAPIFGWITDRLKKIQTILIILVIFHTPFYFAINFIPRIEEKSFVADLRCLSNGSYVLRTQKVSDSLLPGNESLECNSECYDCVHVDLYDRQSPFEEMVCVKTVKLKAEPLVSNRSNSLHIKNISTGGYHNLPTCADITHGNCKTKCYMENRLEENKRTAFKTYQFWLMLVLVASSLVATNVIISLSDSACYEQLEQLEGRVDKFGKQKLWYSIGWGAVTLLTGYIIDVANSNNKDKTDYSWCFYLMLPIMFCDVITLTQVSVTKTAKSPHILKDIGKIFTKPHPFFIVIAVYLVGVFSGLQWNYKFWYLEDMGAGKLLLGLSSAISYFCGHVPCLFISGWIIDKIGRDNSMCLAFVAFSAWFVPASYLFNPWWILAFDLTQGPCFGLFYAAMSSYAKITAPLGTEATMQTILAATFYGLGVGSGSLLGGLGFDNYGGRMTFRFSGFFAIASMIVYKAVTRWVAGEQTGFDKGDNELEGKTSIDVLAKTESKLSDR